MATGMDIVGLAREWIGTPYVWGQGAKGLGTDCGFFITAVLREAGVADINAGAYPRDATRTNIRRACFENFELIADVADGVLGWADVAQCAAPGDIILMTAGIKGPETHLAFRSDYGLIHAHEGVGRVVETRYAAPWTRITRAVFRPRGLEV